MKKRHILPTLITVFCLLSVLTAAFFPPLYGGANLLERIARFDDGGNFGTTLADSTAVAVLQKSAVFDITNNGHEGVFIYDLDTDKNQLETYLQIGNGNTSKASYILIKNGVQYRFAMNADGWYFEDSRVCLTDFRRLFRNLSSVITNKKINTAELETDLNGLTGLDLSEYFDFSIVPTVIRSIYKSFSDESFQLAAGYSFARENFTLKYTFSPADSPAFAEKISSLLSIAYTNKTRSLVNIAGIAGSLADLFGFNFSFPDAECSLSMGAFSGKLQSFQYESDRENITVTNRKYGNCDIHIESAQLEALLIKHVV